MTDTDREREQIRAVRAQLEAELVATYGPITDAEAQAYDEELAAYMRTRPTTGDLAEDVRRICEQNRQLFAELARELDSG